MFKKRSKEDSLFITIIMSLVTLGVAGVVWLVEDQPLAGYAVALMVLLILGERYHVSKKSNESQRLLLLVFLDEILLKVFIVSILVLTSSMLFGNLSGS